MQTGLVRVPFSVIVVLCAILALTWLWYYWGKVLWDKRAGWNSDLLAEDNNIEIEKIYVIYISQIFWFYFAVSLMVFWELYMYQLTWGIFGSGINRMAFWGAFLYPCLILYLAFTLRNNDSHHIRANKMDFFRLGRKDKNSGNKAHVAEEILSARWEAERAKFHKILELAGWQLLEHGDQIDLSTGEYAVVIGVALWSSPDLLAIEQLAENFRNAMPKVFLFNIDDLAHEANMMLIMPDAPYPTNNPVVAKYINGQLAEYYVGKAALSYITRLPDIDLI